MKCTDTGSKLIFWNRSLARGLVALAFILNASPALSEVSAPPTTDEVPKKKICPSPKKRSELPNLLKQVEAKYQKAQTLSAEFSQENENVILGQTKKNTGKIYFKRPYKVRWETVDPDKSLLIGNGKTFWFYTPPFEEGERGQVIKRAAAQVQSKLANALLSGSFSMIQDMEIQAKGPQTFLLTPQKGTAGTVNQATIEINAATHLIQKVTLLHHGGNRSEISLTHVELAPKLSECLFIFKTPPNTDEMNG